MSQSSSHVVSIAGRQGGKARAQVLARRDALVEQHLDLAKSIARQIAASLPATFDVEDLTQTGYLGLVKAATNYDPRRHNGTPFSAYARPVVRGAILDSVRRGNYVENTRSSCEELPELGHTPDREAELDQARRSARLARAVASLPEPHKRVVGWYESGDLRVLNLAHSRASQLHAETVRVLRASLS